MFGQVRNFVKHASKRLRAQQHVVRVPRHEGPELDVLGVGVAGEQLFGVEVLVLALGIARAAQFAEARLEGGGVLGRPVGREAVQDVDRFDGGAPVPFGHFAPQLA